MTARQIPPSRLPLMFGVESAGLIHLGLCIASSVVSKMTVFCRAVKNANKNFFVNPVSLNLYDRLNPGLGYVARIEADLMNKIIRWIGGGDHSDQVSVYAETLTVSNQHI